MIVLQILLTILSIVPNAEGQSDGKIDWTNCGQTTKCFCMRTKGLSQQDGPPSDDQLKECDVGLQTRYFTEQSAVWQMQVMENKDGLGTDPKLMLYKGTTELFGCSFQNGIPSVYGDKGRIRKYRIDLFETLSKCKEGYCLCALKLERANYLKQDSEDESIFENVKSIIKIMNSNPQDYSAESADRTMFSKRNLACNPYSFKDRTTSAQDKILALSNKHLDHLKCDDEDYTMRYQKNQESESTMVRLECVDVGQYNFRFKIVEKNDKNEEVKNTLDNPDQYTFYCAATLNELCVSPIPSPCPASEICPKFHKGIPGKPAELICPDKKWLIDDQYYELAEDAACKPSIRDRNNPIFFLSLPSSPDKEVKDARCFAEYDCMKKAKPFTPDCADVKNCATIEYADGSLKCKNPDINLQITSTEPAFNETMSIITCDKKTGSWKNSSGAAIPDSAQIQCSEPIVPQEEMKADLSTGSLTGIIVGIFCGIGLLAAVLFVIGNLAWKKRKWVDMISKKSWIKYSTAERLKHNEAIFDPLLKMNTTDVTISNGLERVHLMLETETEEPEVWENVYLFLVRFNHAIRKEDFQIWKMFTRYLYVQAKNIIDKHGWTSPKPITRKHQKGLIRVVAIRLLTISMFSPVDEGPEKLLRQGYRKLGFHSISQYPHCGVMWAAIFHAQSRLRKNKKQTGRMKKFNNDKFATKLSKLITSNIQLPEDQIIPKFGSINQQAAYALGTYQSPFYQRIFATSSLYLKNESGEVSAQYFKGMIETPIHNPVEILFDMMLALKQDVFMATLYTVAPKTTWITRFGEMCRDVTYYGAPLDASKIQTRFLPEMTDKWPYLLELQTSQEFFERMIDKQSESNRTWLEEHTDKADLKVRPVYITPGAVQLDARVKTGNEKDVNAPNAKSCGGSDSDSKSDGKPGGSKLSNSDGKPKPTGSDSTPERPAAAAPDATEGVTGTGATTGGTTAGGADTGARTTTGVTGATGGTTAA